MPRDVARSFAKRGGLVTRTGMVIGCLVMGWLARTAHADITVTKARIGCLDIQLDGNLTPMVASACDHKMSCSFKAPTEAQYQHAGVKAKTRTFCTQAMEITYTCAPNDFHTVTVPGDAWDKPPAQLTCTTPPAPPAS